MATFSQFKSKYITERRSKNIGDEGTKNIVKKLLGQDAIPDDGGKKGQARIERELGLNKPNTTNKNKTTINKKLTNTKTVNFSSGASGTTPSGSVDLANTDKNFVQNRRTPLNVNKTNTSALNVSNTKNVVNKDKFADVKKFQDLNKRAQEILNKSNNPVSNVSNQNKINKIPQNEVKPVKISNVIKDVNTKTNTIKLPDIKPNTSSLNLKNRIRTSVSLPNFVSTKTPRGNIVTSNLSNYKDPEVDRIIKDAENLKNPKSLKAYKQAKKDFKSFIKNPQVAKKVSPFVKGASGLFAALDGRSDYKASRDMGYNKAQSVARAVTMGLGKYIGGTKGAVLGGKFGLVGAIPGGMAGYHYGGKGAEYAFDSLVSTKGRKRLKKNFTNFMNNLRGKK